MSKLIGTIEGDTAKKAVSYLLKINQYGKNLSSLTSEYEFHKGKIYSYKNMLLDKNPAHNIIMPHKNDVLEDLNGYVDGKVLYEFGKSYKDIKLIETYDTYFKIISKSGASYSSITSNKEKDDYNLIRDRFYTIYINNLIYEDLNKNGILESLIENKNYTTIRITEDKSIRITKRFFQGITKDSTLMMRYQKVEGKHPMNDYYIGEARVSNKECLITNYFYFVLD